MWAIWEESILPAAVSLSIWGLTLLFRYAIDIPGVEDCMSWRATPLSLILLPRSESTRIFRMKNDPLLRHTTWETYCDVDSSPEFGLYRSFCWHEAL